MIVKKSSINWKKEEEEVTLDLREIESLEILGKTGLRCSEMLVWDAQLKCLAEMLEDAWINLDLEKPTNQWTD